MHAQFDGVINLKKVHKIANARKARAVVAAFDRKVAAIIKADQIHARHFFPDSNRDHSGLV